MSIRAYLNEQGVAITKEAHGINKFSGYTVYLDGTKMYLKVPDEVLHLVDRPSFGFTLMDLTGFIEFWTLREEFDCDSGRRQGIYDGPNNTAARAVLRRTDGVYYLCIYSADFNGLAFMHEGVRRGNLTPNIDYDVAERDSEV